MKFSVDIYISFVQIKSRQRYERDPSILVGEVELLYEQTGKCILIIIDEIQKIPM